MNENLADVPVHTDAASVSAPLVKKARFNPIRLFYDRSEVGTGPAVPTERDAAEAKPRDGSPALFTVSIGLVAAGVIVGGFALLARRRSASLVSISHEPVAPSESLVSKQVVTDRETIVVPVTHDELIIERQAIDGVAASPLSQPSGHDEDVLIALSEERLDVSKVVVTEDFIVDTYLVSDIARVSDPPVPFTPSDGLSGDATRLPSDSR